MPTAPPHSFLFQNVTEENLVLSTDALTVQNTGRRTAENVEVVLSNPPDHFQVSPPIDYEEVPTADGNFIIRVPSLGPKEIITVQVLTYAQIFSILNVRSDAGTAEAINFQIQRVFPTWFNVLMVVLLLIGLGFSAYWLIRGIIFVSLGIGVG